MKNIPKDNNKLAENNNNKFIRIGNNNEKLQFIIIIIK